MKKIIIIGLVFFFNALNLNAISSNYVVMDMDNNRVLMGNSINNKRLIASISKIMTCIVAIENSNLDDVVVVDDSILKVTGSSIYLSVGEKIILRDLLYGMMLRSGNDAAIMIAKYVGKTENEFYDLMNKYAKKIGMNNTIFYNSTGLEDNYGVGNQSSAYDMALLTSYAMKNKTFREIFSTINYEARSNIKNYNWYNKNKLLKYDYVTGGKTGYTVKARRTLVTTANINGMNIVVVTLNDPNDWNDHLKIYKGIKNKYNNYSIISKNHFDIINNRLYFDGKVYVNQNVNITMSKEEYKKLKIIYNLYEKEKYNNNDAIGYVKILLDGKVLKEEYIYIKKNKNNNNKLLKWLKKLYT